jgi:NTP pyrophosphatase (non-canonical NTP hydrolase)
MFDKVLLANKGLLAKFPDGDQPYQIMTRLLEEAGELAQQVNHFEGSGIKRDEYGDPDRKNLAAEVKGVLLTTFQLASYYNLAEEVEASLDITIRI